MKLIIHSLYVGLYYMPVYAEADLKKMFNKELLATLRENPVSTSRHWLGG